MTPVADSDERSPDLCRASRAGRGGTRIAAAGLWLSLLIPALAGCAGPSPQAPGAEATPAATVTLDCSLVGLLSGRGLCQPRPPDPAPPPFCTRSLGTVDCWQTSQPFGAWQRPVADGAWALTPEQTWNRDSLWP